MSQTKQAIAKLSDGRAAEPKRGKSVHLRRQHLTANPLVVALDCGGVLTLTLGRGFFVELACTKLGEQTCFFDGTFEAADRDFKWFIFLETNTRHCS